MNNENLINVKDKTINLEEVKRLSLVNCPAYNEYTIFITDFQEKLTGVIEFGNEEDLKLTFNLINSNLERLVAKTKNLAYVSYENLDLDNQCEVIRVDGIEKMYIQTSKDTLHNRRGYALHILFWNGEKREFFYESHLDAERLYHAIDSKIENLHSERVFNS